MTTKYRKRKMVARLPATPCFPEMRDDIVDVAEKRGVSIVQIQREAYALFLETDATNRSKEDTTSSEQERAS